MPVELHTQALGIAPSGWSTTPTSYVHTQALPADKWTINHPLKKFPSVTVVDSAGSVVIGDIKYISSSQITLTFSSGFSGKAYLN